MLRPAYTHEQACHLGPDFVLAHARILPAQAAVHLERLRHFRVTVAKANVELWALLHAERTWLQDVCVSLAWMQTQLSRAGWPQHEVHVWDKALALAGQEPGVWRRLVKRARTTALLHARWQGERQQCFGLLLRRLLRAGAQPFEGGTTLTHHIEVCGICRRSFADLRCWSHHAFEVHGRVREERRLVEGTQCPHCLRHFACTERVCNHLRHNQICRQALLARGHLVCPVPGVGNRKFDDGTTFQLQVVQAEGPTLPALHAEAVDEKHRPDPDVLLRLEECFCCDSSSCRTFEDLKGVYHKAFASKCLQVTRLQATASAWADILEAELKTSEECPLQWSAWHTCLTNGLRNVDWPGWLVPSEADRPLHFAVYRDAESLLPWLDMHELSLPRADQVSGYGRCFAARCPGVGEFISHADCWRNSALLDFEALTGAQYAGLVHVMSCWGLLTSYDPPAHLQSYAQIENSLERLRLLSDLTRGTFYLWILGKPAIVLVDNPSCPAALALRQAAPFSLCSDRLWALGNVQCDDVFSCFSN